MVRRVGVLNDFHLHFNLQLTGFANGVVIQRVRAT